MREDYGLTSYHRCYAKVNLDAISRNFDNLKKLINKDTKICSIVKTDAYGHGSIEISKLLNDKTDFFAVASVEEAVPLRDNGIDKPILILAYSSPLEYWEVIKYKLTPTIYSEEEARFLSEVSLEKGVKTPVHIAVDTGMGRIGFLLTRKVLRR